jgi:DNA end-binding protein Ku
MARPLWKGTLGFGLVSIPVEVYTAVRDLGPHFHFLRRSDRSRIGFQKIAKTDGEPVSKEELVKGYEYEKGRYVVLTEEDFEHAAVKRNSRIDILDFVLADEVDDRYFNKPYYLLPGQGGEKAYALLRDALRETGRLGIGKVVMRSKPHLAAVEVIKDALVLSTLRFRDELVRVTEFEFPDAPVREAELKMATQLIEGLAASWDPDQYTDEYRANLLSIIDAKRRHAKPDLERQEPEADAKVVDLMERLRRSLGKAAGAKGTVKRRGAAQASGKTPPRASGKRPSRKVARKRTTKGAAARRAA